MSPQLRIGLALLAALALTACGDASSHQTEPTTSPSAELEAWRDCVIDRLARIDSTTNEAIKEIDIRMDHLVAELKGASAEYSRLVGIEKSIQANFDSGTEILEAVGLPATKESLRADPDLAAALDELELAIQNGEGLDKAIDNLSGLDADQLNHLNQVLARENDHALTMVKVSNEKSAIMAQREELLREQDDLRAEQEALVAEQVELISQLESALADTPPAKLDWSLCSGS